MIAYFLIPHKGENYIFLVGSRELAVGREIRARTGTKYRPGTVSRVPPKQLATLAQSSPSLAAVVAFACRSRGGAVPKSSRRPACITQSPLSLR